MGRAAVLTGEALERAISLREGAGWSFARIGSHFGVSEAGAANAVLIALCPRKGFRPAVRAADGNLLAEEVERLRLMLRKGLKGVEIALRMGLSQSRVAEERRRYNADLKARGKASLPPPGNGVAYSGARISKATRQTVEALFMEGFGNTKIHERTGVSLTHIGRIRSKLIRRLRRKRECLPGCDETGVRRSQRESVRFISEQAKQELLSLLRQRVPVRRAAGMVGIGLSSAYKLRDAWKVSGENIPAPKLPGRVKAECRTVKLVSVQSAPASERSPLSFEEQLQRVAAGAGIVRTFRPRRADPACTLGGVASGAAAEAA